jgi:phosphatidylglycerol lysyltransferase
MLRLLRHARAHAVIPTADTLARVATIVARNDATAAALALLGDKSIMISQQGDGFLMYGVSGRSWVAMGDPVGDDAARHDLAWSFVEAADEHGAWPVFYEVSASHLPLYIDLGLTLLKMGEEAIVPLASFSLEGAARKGLRRTRRDVEKSGATFAMVDRAEVPSLLPVLREISDEWLASKATREKSFSLGRFDEQYLVHFPHAVIRVDDRIVAFANVWTGNGRELSLDLMRYRREAPPGVMEYLCVALMLWGAEHGFERMSLGMAPLSGLEVSAIAPLWNRVGGLLYRHGENFYNFQGLRRYKEKFDPGVGAEIPGHSCRPRPPAHPHERRRIDFRGHHWTLHTVARRISRPCSPTPRCCNVRSSSPTSSASVVTRSSIARTIVGTDAMSR